MHFYLTLDDGRVLQPLLHPLPRAQVLLGIDHHDVRAALVLLIFVRGLVVVEPVVVDDLVLVEATEEIVVRVLGERGQREGRAEAPQREAGPERAEHALLRVPSRAVASRRDPRPGPG